MHFTAYIKYALKKLLAYAMQQILLLGIIY